MSTATITDSGFISTCNCIAGIPWDCDTCYTTKRDHASMMQLAHTILKGIRAENAIQHECARTSHQSQACYCSGAMRLKGLELYRESLNLARNITNARRAWQGDLPLTTRAA